MFSTTAALGINRKPESKIRTPSKKALAAKARRRAALAAKSDARLLKLPLKEAIGILRVSMNKLLIAGNSFQQHSGCGSCFPKLAL